MKTNDEILNGVHELSDQIMQIGKKLEELAPEVRQVAHVIRRIDDIVYHLDGISAEELDRTRAHIERMERLGLAPEKEE